MSYDDQLAVFFDIFFSISNKTEEEENGLIAQLEESERLRSMARDSAKKRESKNRLKMEKELELSGGGLQLPLRCGISEMQNGRKVLTVEHFVASNSSPSAVSTSNGMTVGDGEQETAERELKHFNLDDVYKKLSEKERGSES